MTIRRYRQTKIVATLGPASANADVIEQLFKTGVDVFRLNFSHGSHTDHQNSVTIIRNIEKKYNRAIGILADLQGPKFRIGTFENDKIDLTIGQEFTFDSDKETPGDKSRVYLPHPDIIATLNIDDVILLDDGKVKAQIIGKTDTALKSKIITGQSLSNRKGFNIPGVVLPVPAMTDKDKTDMEAAINMGADWIALSFVQRIDDIYQAKQQLKGRASLMIKVEKPSAVENIDAMIDAADGVMVARGDLGVEIPPENVPAVQKQITRKARRAGKPVIVATQMLESMIEHSRPTRAEASDVATAVYDGADAVMLSAETAMGAYPVDAVAIMSRICEQTERDPAHKMLMTMSSDTGQENSGMDTPSAITQAAVTVAGNINAAIIVNYTSSGSTALRTAKERPNIPILCLTQQTRVARSLSLSYGVRSLDIDEIHSFTETVEIAKELVKDHGYAQTGDNIVMTAGAPFGVIGTTNMLRIIEID